ncbi:MAG: nucleoid occlusion protein [Sporolactobacillus sp.]|jgi:ParB family chromosome partitioning protein|nr:nucleoid occlusion protein [Sporolactobacillus sp.]MCI1881421.1 nucleoid occlusion protein [Sporolactobacillus sp.]
MKHSLSDFFNQGGAAKNDSKIPPSDDEDRVQEISVEKIVPNQYQPRSVFNEEKLHELASTIRSHGVIQPIVIRPLGDHFEIIAGERRWRACKYLGRKKIPAIVKSLDDDQTASLALIENLQREELTAIEEAMAYARLIDIHGLTQEGLARKLGKGQSTIANKLRLLKLPPAVQSAILEKKISERHARALVMLKDQNKQEKLLQEVIKKQLNVKQTEDRVRKLLDNHSQEKKKSRRLSLSRDTRIAVNTIRQSVHMVSDTGLSIDTEEADLGDFYQFVIRIPKKK